MLMTPRPEAILSPLKYFASHSLLKNLDHTKKIVLMAAIFSTLGACIVKEKLGVRKHCTQDSD